MLQSDVIDVKAGQASLLLLDSGPHTDLLHKDSSSPLGTTLSMVCSVTVFVRVLMGLMHMCMFMHAQSNHFRQVSFLSHSFSLLCSRSLSLYFEMHMSSITQHVPVLSDLVQAKQITAEHSLFNFKKPEKSGLCPTKATATTPYGPLLSGRVLTRFRLDSDSSISSAGLADPYLWQRLLTFALCFSWSYLAPTMENYLVQQSGVQQTRLFSHASSVCDSAVLSFMPV